MGTCDPDAVVDRAASDSIAAFAWKDGSSRRAKGRRSKKVVVLAIKVVFASMVNAIVPRVKVVVAIVTQALKGEWT